MMPCRQVEDPSETRRFVCKIKERMEGEDYKVLWMVKIIKYYGYYNILEGEDYKILDLIGNRFLSKL